TEQQSLQTRLDTLLDKLESGLIDDADFKRRYQPLKQALSENRLAQEQAQDASATPDAAVEALNASFEEVASFANNWEFLDDEGKKLKLQTVVKEIKVRKDHVDMQVFLDVEDVVRTGKHVQRSGDVENSKSGWPTISPF
ncbi:MAG: hypothetical protein V1758_08860, partial [Pseudomonadota bacterium]